MKKRILSALLALVMVLALLPATAFAVNYTAETTPQTSPVTGMENGKSTLQYYKLTQLNYGYGITEPGWYWLDNKSDQQNQKYWNIGCGVVAGNVWYQSAMDAINAGRYNFTLLNGGSVTDWGAAASVTLQVDLNGYSLTVPAWEARVTNITLTDPNLSDHPGRTSSFGGITKNDGTKPFTLKATNVGSVGSISLTGNRNTVLLDNSALTGNVTLDGTTAATNGTTYTGQSFTMRNGASITGTVAITGDNNTIQLSNATVSSTFTVNASGGTVQISDNCTIGAITVGPHANQAVNTTLPIVNVSGSTVNSLARNAAIGTSAGINNSNLNTFTVNSSNIPGGITTEYGTVSVTSSTVGGAVTVKAGSLTLNGATLTGALTLGGASSDEVNLTITGTNNTIGATINKVGSINKNNRFNPPADPTNGNTWGAITDTTNEAISKITGGTFLGPVPSNWLVVSGNEARAFELSVGGKYTYHSQAQLGDILTTQNLNAGNVITYIPARLTGLSQTITFVNGSEKLGEVKGNGYVPIVAPSQVAGRGTPSWYYNKTSYDAGSTLTTGTEAAVQIDAQLTSSEITKLTDVNVRSSNLKDSLRAALTQSGDGGTISLSGGVSTSGSTAIEMDLTTDMVLKDQGGTVVLRGIKVVYNSTSGVVTFSADNATNANYSKYGVTFEATSSGLTILRLSNGKKYSLTNGGINVIQSSLKIACVDEAPGANTGNSIIATVNIGSLGQAGQKALAAKIQGTDDGATPGVFNWYNTGNESPAMIQALNAEAAKITSTQISQWINQAQQAAWRTRYTGSATAAQLALTGYDEVWLVPYLAMTVTQQNDGGTMTATLTPSFRVEVRQSAAGAATAATNKFTNPFTNLNRTNPTQYPFVDRFVAQQGRSLGTLTGDVGTIYVRFGSNLSSLYANTYMHQDGTYVYPASATGTWIIRNAGSNGLGSVVINKTPATVEMQPGTWTTTWLYYDNLQAAVDQTVKQAAGNEDEIILKQSYAGSTTINVTGEARTFMVKTEGNHTLTAANNNFTVSPTGTGKDWTVQLTKDVLSGGSVAITVQTVTNGSASVSTNRAKAGDTVTVTTTPNGNYSTLGVSAVGNNNTSISVSGSGNSWSFKVPENVTSITVTPSFGVAGQASISVNNVGNGSATVANGASVVTQGSTVTVYTVPKTGYRATGVSVTFSNGTTVNATNTGTNTWTFTVPAGATAVTVTPSFTMDSGLPFTDVPANNFYLDYVKFVYKHGMMEGFGNKYTFNGNGNVTRAQLVLILYRLSGSPAISSYANFKDVPANAWYSQAVAWASANKIVDGRPGNVFDPGTAVTRQEFATILYRYNSFRGLGAGNKSNLSQFTDRGYVQSYALEAMQWAVGNGIIGGTTNTTLSPNGTAIRFQAAAMLTRYCQTFLKMS